MNARKSLRVVIFLEQAGLRVREWKKLTLSCWRKNVERLPESDERPVMEHAGNISAGEMKPIAPERLDAFDEHPKPWPPIRGHSGAGGD